MREKRREEILEIIKNIDVKKDHVKAEEMAQKIQSIGNAALEVLVELGESSLREKNIRQLRAILLALKMFCEPRFFLKPRIYSKAEAIKLICKLSSQGGFVSSDIGDEASHLVYNKLGLKRSDVYRVLLLSLPILSKDLYTSDKHYSLKQIIDEIDLVQSSYSIRHIALRNSDSGDYFIIGSTDSHQHYVARVDANSFIYCTDYTVSR